MKPFRWLGLAIAAIALTLNLATVSQAADLQGGMQWGTTALPMEGEPAPTFALPDSDGNVRRLEDWQGKWVVLYFYPKDFTSGCTIEARRFQQDLPKYAAIDAEIIGISADSVSTHREFCDSEGLKFPLLSDSRGEVSQLYGSWMGDIALRNTFVIDPDGNLAAIYPIVNPSTHSKDLLMELDLLKVDASI